MEDTCHDGESANAFDNLASGRRCLEVALQSVASRMEVCRHGWRTSSTDGESANAFDYRAKHSRVLEAALQSDSQSAARVQNAPPQTMPIPANRQPGAHPVQANDGVEALTK
jgi:hypothetical protein